MQDNCKEPQPQRQGQVSSWLDRLENEINNAFEIQERIIARLNPVLNSSGSSNESKPKELVRGPLVELAQTLQQLTDKVAEQSSKYEEMLDCLEL